MSALTTPDAVYETFHKFTHLPQELRDKIWAYCLPSRVCEDGYNLGRLIWEQVHRGQQWDLGIVMHTRAKNRLPPLLTQVCHESRKASFFAGRIQQDDRERLRPGPYKYNFRGWEDRSRDTYYLDNFPWHGTWDSMAYALEALAARSRYMKVAMHQAILVNLNALGKHDLNYERDRARVDAALEILAEALRISVVLYDYEIIADVSKAQSSGLFGICGDAYCQIIDVEDEWEKLEEFFECAVRCSIRSPDAMLPLEESKLRLTTLLAKTPVVQPIASKLRAAVNVQLCDEKVHEMAWSRTLLHNVGRMRVSSPMAGQQ